MYGYVGETGKLGEEGAEVLRMLLGVSKKSPLTKKREKGETQKNACSKVRLRT